MSINTIQMKLMKEKCIRLSFGDTLRKTEKPTAISCPNNSSCIYIIKDPSIRVEKSSFFLQISNGRMNSKCTAKPAFSKLEHTTF